MFDECLDSDGIGTKDPQCVITATVDFYSTLYSAVPDSEPALDDFFADIPPQSLPPNLIEALIAPIQVGEVEKVVAQSPCCKSPGPDGIPFEVYRALGPTLLPHLVILFNHILSSLSTLPGGAMSFIILLFKKGEPTSLANWRPIALSNTDYKLLTKILSL